MLYIQSQQEQGVKNRFDGCAAIGHRFLSWLIGPVLSQRYGIRYIYNDIVPEELDSGWNEFLGFDKIVPSKLNEIGAPQYSLENIKNYKIIDMPRAPWDARYDHPVILETINKYKHTSITEDDNIVLKIPPGQGLEIDWSYWLNNDLREKYDFARQKNPVLLDNNSNYIDIVIHWRMGDISQQNQPERWLADKQYYILIQNIQNTLKQTNKKYTIKIVSEGNIQDFGCVRNLDVEFLLNEDPKIAFHRLVAANILVPAKSAFSTLACYLNKKIIFVIPFSIYFNQHYPHNDNFKNMIDVDSDMDFDVNKIRSILKHE